jgi:hypothetical protein
MSNKEDTPEERMAALRAIMGVGSGYCKCGCGGKTRRGNKFIYRHNVRGANNPNWKGGKQDKANYILLSCSSSQSADLRGRIREHIAIAENVLGKWLPPNAVVHHIDGNGKNNAHSNLVICQDAEYHMLLHKRAAALQACSHANWLKCPHCGQYDDPTNMYVYITGSHKSVSGRHRACHAKYCREHKSW